MLLHEQVITLAEVCRVLRRVYRLDATTLAVIDHITRRHGRKLPLWKSRRMVPTGMVEVFAAELAVIEGDNRRMAGRRVLPVAFASRLDDELAGVE